MALIVVYRYDLFYVPWSMDGTVPDTSGAGDGNSTAASNGTSPRPPNDVKRNDSDASSKPERWPYGPVRRITTSGSGAGVSRVGEISNGVADYLYESKPRQSRNYKKKTKKQLSVYRGPTHNRRKFANLRHIIIDGGQLIATSIEL